MQEIINTFGIDWRLLVIQAVNFGLLLLILWYFLYTPLLAMIEKRRTRIAEGLTNADKAETKLEEVKAEEGKILNSAIQEAGKIVTDAKHRGEEKEHGIVAEAHGKSERIVKDAQARAAETKRQSIAESEAEIARLAILGAEKILNKQLH